MAQINKPSDYFNTVLYTGDGTSSNAITGVNFKPDLLWIKQRDVTRSHQFMDVVRGASVRLLADQTAAESASALTSFDSDGFTVDGSTLNGTNANGGSFVAWNWLAGSTASSNTDGSITSTVSANTTSGFSIVTYTGTNSNETVGHGLGVAPEVVMIKNRSDTESWWVGHQGAGSIGDGKYLFLNSNNAVATNNTSFCNANPTTTTFKAGGSTSADNAINGSGDNMLAYCFAEIEGYSKFGRYTGNGSSDGTFVYTGFRPAFIITRRINTSEHWAVWDSTRDTFNVAEKRLAPNDSVVEATSSTTLVDFLSNGFKPRSNNTAFNGSYDYIYMAFGQSLVGSNNVPCTAR